MATSDAVMNAVGILPNGNEKKKLCGTLKKWTNYVYGWQNRYFEIENGVILYYKTAREKSYGSRGAITIRCAELSENRIDSSMFAISANGTTWYLRAENHAMKDVWTKALKSSAITSSNSKRPSVCSNISATPSTSSLTVEEIERKIEELEQYRSKTEEEITHLRGQLKSLNEMKKQVLKAAHSSFENTNVSAVTVTEMLSDGEQEWFDANETLSNSANEEKIESKEKKESIDVNIDFMPNGIISLPSLHGFTEEIIAFLREQLRYAKTDDDGRIWELFWTEGEMKMYRREMEVDGLVKDPLKAVHFVKGVSAREYIHFFFEPKYKEEWDETLEKMITIEEISADTVVLQQVHKRVWPSAQRESLFWSHVRQVNAEKDDDALDLFVVCNHNCDHPQAQLFNSSNVRVGLTVAMVCQTVPLVAVSDRTLTRDDIGCRIIYVACVDPGTWVPAAALRVIYKREYPKFLKGFTKYVVQHVKDRPLIL